MGASFFPTRQDVQRYLSLRALGMSLGSRMIKTIPRQAYDAIGDALGILRNGILLLDSPDMTSVLADCCLYDWFENGKNLAERYVEMHPAAPGTDESYLLQAYLRAKYRIVVAQSTVPDAGVYCRDALNGEELFLMDLGLSRSIPDGNVAIATRTIPLGEYSMTGGAGLPITSKKAVLDGLRQIGGELHKPLQGPGGLSLTIARACLAAGAADNITYQSTEADSRKPRNQPSWPRHKPRRRR